MTTDPSSSSKKTVEPELSSPSGSSKRSSIKHTKNKRRSSKTIEVAEISSHSGKGYSKPVSKKKSKRKSSHKVDKSKNVHDDTCAKPIKRNAEDILAAIDQIDVQEIKIRHHAKKYLKTLHGYLECYRKMGEEYDAIDPQKTLANYDMEDINLGNMVQTSVNGEPVKDIVELYEVAEAAFSVYVAKINDLISNVTNEDGADDTYFKLPPGKNQLKGKRRASKKAETDYSDREEGPAISYLFDIVRGSVVFSSPSKLIQFLELIRKDDSIQIVKSKNRFKRCTLSGYRDYNLQIQITLDDGMKHICELQLHQKNIKALDEELGSHKYYEFFRKYYAGSTDTLEERMEDLRQICDGGELNVKFLRQVVENPLERERMYRLSDLFLYHVNDYQFALVICNATRKNMKQDDQEEYSVLLSYIGEVLLHQGRMEEAMAMYSRAVSTFDFCWFSRISLLNYCDFRFRLAP